MQLRNARKERRCQKAEERNRFQNKISGNQFNPFHPRSKMSEANKKNPSQLNETDSYALIN